MTKPYQPILLKPCPTCPFRNDKPFTFASSHRVTEIEQALVTHGEAFTCHDTIDYGKRSPELRYKNSKHCAGAAILLVKLGKPNQSMQLADRLGLTPLDGYDLEQPIYGSFDEMRSKQP